MVVNRVLDDDSYKKLMEIGLNPREAKLYLSLVENPGETAVSLPQITAIPRNKVYYSLQKLWHMGIIEQRVVGRKKVYNAVDPETAIKRVIELKNEQEETRNRTGGLLTAKLSPVFFAGQASTRELAYMSFIKSPEVTRRRFNELQRKVHKEILLFSKGPYILSPKENIEELEALERGVEARVIYEASEAMSQDFIANVGEYIKAGEQVRVGRELPMKLAIFDRRTVLLCMKDPGSTQLSMVTIVIDHPDLAMILHKSFEQYWMESVEWEDFNNI